MKIQVVKPGMRVIVKLSGLEAKINTVCENKFIIYYYDKPTYNYGDGGATTVEGLVSIENDVTLIHPSSAPYLN